MIEIVIEIEKQKKYHRCNFTHKYLTIKILWPNFKHESEKFFTDKFLKIRDQQGLIEKLQLHH